MAAVCIAVTYTNPCTIMEPLDKHQEYKNRLDTLRRSETRSRSLETLYELIAAKTDLNSEILIHIFDLLTKK